MENALSVREKLIGLADRVLTEDEEKAAYIALRGRRYTDSHKPMSYRTVLSFSILLDELERIDEKIHLEIGHTLKEIADDSKEYVNLGDLVGVLDKRAAMHKQKAAEIAERRKSSSERGK